MHYKNRKHLTLAGALFFALLILLYSFYFSSSMVEEQTPVAMVQRRKFTLRVQTIGELEASKSTAIASTVRGDAGKIIWIIADGASVKPGELLIKLDPTPFEEKIEEIHAKIKEQEAGLPTFLKTMEWEINQAEMENKTAGFETETAEMELNKIVKGDGPQEIARLKANVQKARVKYEELKSYSSELEELQKKGVITAAEGRQAQKKLQEEKEGLDDVALQYESYLNHVYPMLVKKAETHLKRSRLKEEEAKKTGVYKVAKAEAALQAIQQGLSDLKVQLRSAERELMQTEIKAPTQGMVVLREEYRGSQKRKPRVGDIVVKNQPLLDLPDLESMTVKTKLREIDLCKICLGKKASIEVDAYPQLLFQGNVASIGVLALTDLSRTGDEKFFEVKVQMDNPDQRLRPGMTARVSIHADSVDNSLTIPCQAIFEEDKSPFCYLKSRHGFVKQPVVTGISNEEWTEILSGLKEDDLVSLAHPENMYAPTSSP